MSDPARPTGHGPTLGRFLLNHWRSTQEITERLYPGPPSAKSLRAARQAITRLRSALGEARWPIEIPAGRSLVLDERWERKKSGRGGEKFFRLRLLEDRTSGAAAVAGEGTGNYLQMWIPADSWSGWIVEGFRSLERDRLINHKHLYTDVRGPDNWLSVASGPVYLEAERTAGRAIYDELHGPDGGAWSGSGDLVYVGLGTGSGRADCCVVRELLESDKARCIRVVPVDFSPVLLSETVSNLYQEFKSELEIGRLAVLPILGDIEQPDRWARLLPPIERGTSLVVGMFGNTLGHLQYRERQTLQRVFDALDGWAARCPAPRWTSANSRVLLGISLQRRDGAPHGRDGDSLRKWLNLIADPLITLLETAEGEYQIKLIDSAPGRRVQGRTAVAELRPRNASARAGPLGVFWHEEMPYKPSDGITGVVQRYEFEFTQDLTLPWKKVFRRHHVPEAQWSELSALTAEFRAGVDRVVLVEVTQFNPATFRPALRRMGALHGDHQLHVLKLGNIHPYAILAFARA